MDDRETLMVVLSYQSLLADFAAEIGIDAAALSRTQELIVDDHVIGLYLDVEDGLSTEEAARLPESTLRAACVVFFTLLGEADHARLPVLLRSLLEANSLWTGTSGCTLGLQRGSNQVILCGQLALSTLDGAGLAAVLNGFCETASFWRSFVTETRETENVGPMATSSLPFSVLNSV